MKFNLLLLVHLFLIQSISATVYYVDATNGDDQNIGSKELPFRSLERVNAIVLEAGDHLLLANGSYFRGTLELQNLSGTERHPIVVSSYFTDESESDSRPIIDGRGYLNGILVNNSSHIIIEDLEITADGGGVKSPVELDAKRNDYMHCGVLVTTSEQGSFKDISLENILVRDIFFEERGFARGTKEVRTPNGKQNYGWGIRFINATEGATLENLRVESCTIKNVAHTGLKFTGRGKSIHDVEVVNNVVLETGGPGIQMSGVNRGTVKGNSVNLSGSSNDSRKWGRGSGLWTWGSSNIVIEHNLFKNASGPGDSAGCHIDFNCNDIIVQYNHSENNAGGFCEILGNNFNCAYRYNISINDGYRVKGKDGAFQEGKIFWLSGYQGNKKRSGPFNSYFYNNTIYVKEGIVAKVAVNNASSGVLIANNIFYIEGESRAVLGDQYKPQKREISRVKNILFQNNLYLKRDNWPQGVLISDEQPIIGDPKFENGGGDQLVNYRALNRDLIKNRGIEIKVIPNDTIGLMGGVKVKRDILGNRVRGLPDMGAIEFEGL